MPLQGSPPFEQAFCLGLNLYLDKKKKQKKQENKTKKPNGNYKVRIDSSEPQDKI